MKKLVNVLLIVLSIIMMAVFSTGVLEADISTGNNNTFISGDLFITNIFGVQNGTDVHFPNINITNDLLLNSDINISPYFWLVDTPFSPFQVVNKKYVDDATSSTAFDFFFNTNVSDISGHLNMTESDLEAPETTLNSISLPVGTTSVFNWTTLIGQPEFNELRTGVYDVHIHLNKNLFGARSVVITPKLYNISVDGSKRTLLITFESTSELTTTIQEFELHGVLNNPIMLTNDVRLNLELEATVSGGGTNPIVTITLEGTTDSHITVETSSNAFEKIFIRRDGTNSLLGDWNTGNFNIFGMSEIRINNDKVNLSSIGDVNATKFYGAVHKGIMNGTDANVTSLVIHSTTTTGNAVNINASSLSSGNVLMLAIEGTTDAGNFIKLIDNSTVKMTINEFGTVDIAGSFISDADFANNLGNIRLGEDQDSAIGFDGNDMYINPRIQGIGNLLLLAGFFGVGATNPVYRLQIQNDVNGKDLNVSNVLFVNGSSGNVGIGTDSPEAKLHVLSGDVGVAPHANANDQVVENTGGHTGISILCDDNFRCLTYYGSPSDSVGAFTQWVYDDLNFQIGSATPKANVSLKAGNAVTVMTLTDNGNVGIGTLKPEQKLHVNGSGITRIRIESSDNSARLDLLSPITSASIINFAEPNDANTGRIVYDFTDEHMRFRVNDAERMRIIANGNVGIGTTSPEMLFSISGGNFSFDKDTEDNMIFKDVNAGTPIKIMMESKGELKLIAGTQTTIGQDLLIDGGNSANDGDVLINSISTGGDVGIGTSVPIAELHISESGAAANIITERIDASVGDGSVIGSWQVYGGEDGIEAGVGTIDIIATAGWTASNSETKITFSTTSSGSTSDNQRVIIDENGFLTGSNFISGKEWSFCGEEVGGLVAGQYPFSLGNGANPTPGFLMPSNGHVTWASASCITCTDVTSTLEVRLDTTGTDCEFDIGQVGVVTKYGLDIGCTDEVSMGQIVRGYVIDDAGTCAICSMCIGGQFE